MKKMIYSGLSDNEKREISKIIKEELAKMPPFLIDKCTEYDRITLDTDLLNIVLDSDSFGVEFTIDELRKLDLSSVDFSGKDISKKDFSYTNAIIDPQKVKDKSLWATNLEGLDLSDACFDDVCVDGVNLKGTGAKIIPHKVRDWSLWNANLEGLDLSNACFDDVSVDSVNLKGTGAKINPRRVRNKSLWNANLEGLDLSNACFDGVNIENANLKDTGSVINARTVSDVSVDTNLLGCYILDSDLYTRSLMEGLPYSQCTLKLSFENEIREHFEKHRQKTIGIIDSFRR